MSDYDVFISFKHHDADQNVTKDFEMAKELYELLKAGGKNPFLSEASLATQGASLYKAAIDDALDSADILIVVGTSTENLTSSWVNYEWDSFFNDIISGVKSEAKIFTLTSGVNQRELPRVLRQVQGFDYDDNGLSNICTFLGIESLPLLEERDNSAKTDAQVNLKSSHKAVERKSLYTESDHGEKNRLQTQFELVGRHDVDVLAALIAKLDKKDLCVLDVGCASGYVTREVFSSLEGIGKVIGIDKFQESVDVFNELAPDNRFSASCIDVEAADATQQIEGLMAQHGISHFDLVYSVYTLHHLTSPKETLRMLRHFIAPGGLLFGRSADDGAKVYYPDPDNVVTDTLKKTSELPTVSDRFYGRKMYNDFVLAGFDNVNTIVTSLQTTSKTPNEKYIMYQDAFSWRKNNFKKFLDTATGDDIITAMDEYSWICQALDKIEELFYLPNFYYSSDTFTCYGYA